MRKPILWIAVVAMVLGLGAWAKEVVGPQAIWNPSSSVIQEARSGCGGPDAPKTKGCWVGIMKGAGAPKEAMKFAELLSEPGCLRDIRPSATISVAYVLYPFRANENSAYLLVNGRPEIVDVDDQAVLPKAEMEKDPVYADLAKKYPQISLWPGDRYSASSPGMEPQPGGIQRFLVDYKLLDGCHACEQLGTAYFGFDFEESGKLKGVTFVRVENAKDVRKTIELSVGQEFTVHLKSNQTTGYKWDFAEPMPVTIVRMNWTLYNAPDPQIPGAGGEEVFSFKAIAPGKGTIKLAYARPWEKGVAPAQMATYEVVVK